MATATATKETESKERSIEKKGQVARVGNLTRDFELRFASSGTAYARSSLAVETPKKAGDWAGERVTTFYELTLFGTLAEHAVESFGKGTRVLVIGNAEVEHWIGDDGQERTTKRILANAIGPDVRWATVEVQRATRKGPDAEEAPTSDADDEEEPF